ncbi:MAG: tol-pal system-associated acyl-CoA thioesterase [Magnetococcus sp. DMHC-1]|nr:tol-pal system-associated acyl-CoA thioesterase [Magnetococcales bacterium]
MTATPFQWPVRVYYEDTDAAGVVYHANYLQFMERCRTEWLRSLGIDQQRFFRETGLQFAVAHMEIAFLGPARLDDLLTVTTRLSTLRRASIHLEQEILRPADQSTLIRATVRIACIDARFRPQRIPGGILSPEVTIQPSP